MKGRDRPRKKGIAIMALTKSQVREYLSEAGIEAAKASAAVDKIIDGHTTSINVLRERAETAERERDALKADAEKLQAVQQELDALKAADWEGKYKAEHEAHEKLKADTEAAAANAAKKAALDELLNATFTASGVEKIQKYGDFSAVELTKDGKVKGADKLLEGLKAEWGDFVKTTTTTGADIANPPTTAAPSASFKSLSDAMKYANEHPGENIDFSALLPPAPTVTA